MRGIEREVLPAAAHFGLGLLPYFPLASGMLTGKYQRNATMPAGARLTETERLADRYLKDSYWPIVEKLTDFATARGHSLLELAFSWLLSHAPVASVIAGATRGGAGEGECRGRVVGADGGGVGCDRRDHQGVAASPAEGRLPPACSVSRRYARSSSCHASSRRREATGRSAR